MNLDPSFPLNTPPPLFSQDLTHRDHSLKYGVFYGSLTVDPDKEILVRSNQIRTVETNDIHVHNDHERQLATAGNYGEEIENENEVSREPTHL